MKKKILGVLLATCMVFTMGGCGSSKEKEVEALIEKVEQSVNDIKIKELLDCFDPDETVALRMIYEAGSFIGDVEKAAEELIEYVVEEYLEEELPDFDFFEDHTLKESLEVLEITPIKFDLGKTTGRVRCKLSVELFDDEYIAYAEAYVIKVNDQWMIHSVDILSNREIAEESEASWFDKIKPW